MRWLRRIRGSRQFAHQRTPVQAQCFVGTSFGEFIIVRLSRARQLRRSSDLVGERREQRFFEIGYPIRMSGGIIPVLRVGLIA